MNTEETKFHEHRVAFAIIDGSLHSIANDSRSHKEWLMEEFNLSVQDFEVLIRGYVLEDNIVFYRGANFICDDEVIAAAHKYFRYLLNFTSSNLVNVCAGVKMGQIGEVWPPEKFLFQICRLSVCENKCQFNII